MKFLFFLLPFVLIAKPSGMQTISGNATCKEEAGVLVIESGKRAIVKWDEFSIGKGERVRFSMPDSKSAVLNRVSGGESRLLGQLDSNGKIYLLNPKGVLIGKDAVINTASFVASSLDVLDQDFLRGEELLFSGDSQEGIVNLGTISCLQGDVALIAHHVANRGKIEGNYVGLASGPEILLKPKGNQRIFVKAKGGDSIQNTGRIEALTAELRSGSVYDHAICCSGKIEAVQSKTRGGRVYLVAENGTTDLNGTVVVRGGQVQILGKRVFLRDHAEIDVSGSNGGGKVFVGGDYQGMNPEIFNSTDVVVSRGAIVKADAEELGNGGRIIFWADRSMQHYGEIFARGGAEGGDGGFVEVSGFKGLDFQGSCDSSAANGSCGQLLLDPDADVTISNAANSGIAFASGVYSPTAIGANLMVSTLETALASNSVSVTTSGTATTNPANITVDDDITWTSSNSLSLLALDGVEINAVVTGNSASFFASGESVSVNGTSGGAISAGGVTLTASSGEILIENTSVTSTLANVKLTADSGNILVDSSTITVPTNTQNNSLTMLVRQDIGINDGISIIGGSVCTAGDFNFNSTVTGVGNSGKAINIVDSTLTASDIVTITGNSQDDDAVTFSNSTFSYLGATDVTITGISTAATVGGLNGIHLLSGSLLETQGAGAMNFFGDGSADPSASNNVGVRIDDSTINSTASATGGISIFGNGASGIDNCFGIEVNSASTISSTNGDIILNGNSGAVPPTTGQENFGVVIDGASAVTSLGNADISIIGVGGDGTDSNFGVFLTSGAMVSSVNGDINIQGNQADTPSVTGSNNFGININGGVSTTSVVSTGSGSITLLGRGGAKGGGGNSNRGVRIDGSGTVDSAAVTSVSGPIVITATPGTGTPRAFQLIDGGLISTTGSSITINSTSGVNSITGSLAPSKVENTNPSGVVTIKGFDSSSSFGAVELSDSIITAAGAARITGVKSGGTGAGINFEGMTISTGSGTLLTGTGFSDHGVTLNSGTTLTVTSGTSIIEGTVSSSSLGSVNGVFVDATSSILGTGGALRVIGSNEASGVSDLFGILLSGATVTNSGTGTFSFTGFSGEGVSDEGIRMDSSSSVVSSSSGPLSFTGHALGDSTIGIHITDSGSVASTGSAPITLQTFSDIVIDEGGTVTGGGGLLDVMSDRDLIITGGSAAATPSGIFLGSGNGRFSVERNLDLFGGSGAGSFAQIGALTDSSANLVFSRIGGRLLVDGVNTNSYAIIGHGDPTVGAATFSGNILFREIRGETIVRGAATDGGGALGFGQIGHIDGAGATLSGDVKFLTKRSLLVLGGSAAASAYARIGHGGQGGGGTFGASVMDLLIGQNIRLRTVTGEAQIVNPSPSSPLTLVADNLHPKPPEFGLAGIMQAGTLTANGELRIYTVARALNTVTNMINGEVFAPPLLPIDNPQEEFSVYFPGGTFSTASFRFYYKLPIPTPFPHENIYNLGVANAQLQDELPIFRYMRLPNYPEYHANFCGETAKGINCLNNLDPYGSFIFEDNVYWVGGR